MKARYLILFLLVALLGGFALAGGKYPMAEVVKALASQSVGDARAWSSTLKEMTPLLLCGIGVFAALRAGLFNIGIEGQFMIGALASAVVGVNAPAGPVGALLALGAGCMAGSLWAAPAGWIRAYRGGHEVITTIMLNQVAGHLSLDLLKGTFQAPKSSFPTTSDVPESSLLPMILGTPQFSLGLLLGLGLLAGTWVWFKRTVRGFEHEAVGANPKAATLAGIDPKRVLFRSMCMSGAIGGLGGAIQVLAYERRAYEAFSSGYGFDSLGVALLAGGNPLFVAPAALAFGALKAGISGVAAIYETPKGVGLLLLGLTLVVFAALRYRRDALREAA